MEDILAIIHAPGEPEAQLNMLMNKLLFFLERFDLKKSKIELNPTLPLGKAHDNNIWNGIIFCWGLPAKPSWDKVFSEYNVLNFAQELLVFDFFERQGITGRNLYAPNIHAGRYWSQKVQKTNMKLFMEGYYLKSTVPYGLKRISKKSQREKPSPKRYHYILQPGEIDKTEIVKLIFDLFVNHDYTHTQIANLLLAQSIKPPGRSQRWQMRTVRAILNNPFYIGANEFKGNIRYDVFTPLIDKPTFYEAQAKIMRKQITRKDIRDLNSNSNLSLQVE